MPGTSWFRKAVADVLEQVSTWKTALHDLGEAEVKHRVRVHLYNLFTDEAGNRELPQKLRSAQTSAANVRSQSTRKKLSLRAGVAGVIAMLGVGGVLLYQHWRSGPKLSDKETIVLADFDNKTGDPIFNETLKPRLRRSLGPANVLSNGKVTKTLQLMTRPADTKLTPDVARELCRRAGSQAYVAGSIGAIGTKYVLQLTAMDCQSGDTLAEEQATSASKEKVLDALDDAGSKLRGELGQSLASVQKSDVQLLGATTSSIDALDAFSRGRKLFNEKGSAEALPYHKYAVKLDPNFAIAYYALGKDYLSLGEPGRASENFAQAYQLREHTSDVEKIVIVGSYYETVTGELDRASQIYDAVRERYDPTGKSAFGNTTYAERGQYQKAAELNTLAMHVAPGLPRHMRISPPMILLCSASMRLNKPFTMRRRISSRMRSFITSSMLAPF